MTTRDKYTDTVRQGQEAWTAAVQSFQKAATQPVKPWGDTDPAAAIDQIFDFWEQSLIVQRELAKQLVGMTVATGESVRSQAQDDRHNHSGPDGSGGRGDPPAG